MSPEELQNYLVRRSINRKVLALSLGVSEAAVRLWLQGKRAIPEPVARIIRYFDQTHTPIQELIE